MIKANKINNTTGVINNDFFIPSAVVIRPVKMSFISKAIIWELARNKSIKLDNDLSS